MNDHHQIDNNRHQSCFDTFDWRETCALIVTLVVGSPVLVGKMFIPTGDTRLPFPWGSDFKVEGEE